MTGLTSVGWQGESGGLKYVGFLENRRMEDRFGNFWGV